ncbi:TPA: hypothetical protein ACH3X1_001451 [Trebouxia sp. C0004]
MNSLEVMAVDRQDYEDFKLSTTGPQPFSISDNSPGFQLLVNLLSTAKTDIGFVTSHLPHISQLEDHQLTVQLLLKKGTAQLGSERQTSFGELFSFNMASMPDSSRTENT